MIYHRKYIIIIMPNAHNLAEVVTPVRSSSPVILRGRSDRLDLHHSDSIEHRRYHHDHRGAGVDEEGEDTESMMGSMAGEEYYNNTYSSSTPSAAASSSSSSSRYRNTSSLYPDNDELMAVVERSFEVHSPLIPVDMVADEGTCSADAVTPSESNVSAPSPAHSTQNSISSAPSPAHSAQNSISSASNPAHNPASIQRTTSASFTSSANISLQTSFTDTASLNTSTEVSIISLK